MSNFFKFLIILLAVLARVTVARRVPSTGGGGGGLPTIVRQPLTTRFYKNKKTLPFASSCSYMTLSPSSSSAAVNVAALVPRCGSIDVKKTSNNNSKTNNNNVVGEPTRFVILLVGWFVGYMMLAPNVMLCDSGTPKAHLATQFGMLACLLFVLGGTFGYFVNYKLGWKALLPALICQVIAIFLIRED